MSANLISPRPSEPPSGGRMWPMAKEAVKKSTGCHPERSEGSQQFLMLAPAVYEQMRRSFAALRMTCSHFFTPTFAVGHNLSALWARESSSEKHSQPQSCLS